MSLKEQLCEMMDAASFGPADMSTWTEYEARTIGQWRLGNRYPALTKRKHLAERISLLKKVLAKKDGGLPVPPSVTQSERKAYIEGIRDRALKGIFGARSSG